MKQRTNESLPGQTWATSISISVLLAVLTALPAGAKLLRGSIQIDEKFPVIGAVLSPEAKFGKEEAERLFNLDTQESWFRLPSEFAGTWKTNDSRRTDFIKDERSGTTETKIVDAYAMKCELGTIRDIRQEIWHHQRFPGLSMVDQPVSRRSSSDPPKVQRTRTVVKAAELLFYVCLINSPSGREYNAAANSVAREIQIESYVLTSPTVMQCTIVNRKFNASGQAITFEHTVRDYVKVKPFQPDPEELESFTTFLQTHGLSHLVPDKRFRSNTMTP